MHDFPISPNNPRTDQSKESIRMAARSATALNFECRDYKSVRVCSNDGLEVLIEDASVTLRSTTPDTEPSETFWATLREILQSLKHPEWEGTYRETMPSMKAAYENSPANQRVYGAETHFESQLQTSLHMMSATEVELLKWTERGDDSRAPDAVAQTFVNEVNKGQGAYYWAITLE